MPLLVTTVHSHRVRALGCNTNRGGDFEEAAGERLERSMLSVLPSVDGGEGDVHLPGQLLLGQAADPPDVSHETGEVDVGPDGHHHPSHPSPDRGGAYTIYYKKFQPK